jgi:hypothetical protein
MRRRLRAQHVARELLLLVASGGRDGRRHKGFLTGGWQTVDASGAIDTAACRVQRGHVLVEAGLRVADFPGALPSELCELV